MRTFLVFLTMCVFCLTATVLAQTGVTPTSAQSEPSAAEQKQAEKEKKEQEKKAKQEKKDQGKKAKAEKDKNKKGTDLLDTSAVFNERIANDVLGQIRDGLEGHSRRLMLSAFDSDKMDGYLSFEDQIDVFFERYEAFRVRFRIANVTVVGAKGIVLVDTEMEEIPRGNASAPRRKRAQLRFELERGRKGWRVVDFRDRSFFS